MVITIFLEKKHIKVSSPIDYSGSWLWVGANALNSCDEEHKHYYRGEISFVGVYGRYLSDDEIRKVYENSQSLKIKNNFKTKQLYCSVI